MIRSSNFLLIRNIRGDWTIRLLFEFWFRNKSNGKFGFLEISKKEYFPPYKRAPIFIGSRFREKLITKLVFKKSLQSSLHKKIMTFASSHRIKKLNLTDYYSFIKLLLISDSEKLSKFTQSDIPFGKFIHTTLISKYGVKHFKLTIVKNLGNFLIYYRFLVGFRNVYNLLSQNIYTHIVLINGRDACGVGAQLAAYLFKVNVITLENGFSNSKLPTYGEWQGNMHHWKIREAAIKKIINKNLTKFDEELSLKLNNQFGPNSKFWFHSERNSINNYFLPNDFVVFFTTSEKETTTCPTGVAHSNEFDQYDQSEALIKLYKVIKNLNLYLLIRLHPNFFRRTYAQKEFQYFLNLTKNWKNTRVFSNFDQVNSYELAYKAKCNFAFRSTLAAELLSLGLPCYLLAENSWSFTVPNAVVVNEQQIKFAIQNKKQIHTNFLALKTYSNYLSFHSSTFKSIKLINDDLNNLQQYFEKCQLNVPRFRIKLTRQ